MAAKASKDEVQHVVYISTNSPKGCERCTGLSGFSRFDATINHYIEAHGYRVLHVGQESGRDDLGSAYHFTVAVVGR